MGIDFDPNWSRNTATRMVGNVWHEIVLTLEREAEHMLTLGHTRESAQIYAYGSTMIRHAERHLKQVAESTNGHNKDSLPGPTTSVDPEVNSQAPAVEVGALPAAVTVSSSPPDDAPVTAELGNIEIQIQTAIAQIDDLMGQQPDNQAYEVALKFLHRGRTLAREGKLVLAVRQLRAATNAAHGLKLEVW